MKIYLLRHAEDAHDIIGGWSDIGLTEVGKRQAEESKDYFVEHQNELQIGHIIVSQIRRAHLTVEPIAKALGLDVEEDGLWNGLDWGELNGCSSERSKELYPYLNLWMMDWEEEFPKGESPKGFYQRVGKAWKNLLEKYQDNKNILICTHGVNMVVLETYLKGKVWNHHEKKTFYPCVLMEIDTTAKKIRTCFTATVPEIEDSK